MTRRRRHFLVALILSGLLASQGWAQFVPGHVFSSFGAYHCEAGEIDVVGEVNPETAETTAFAALPPEYCVHIRGMAMSPDGKRLRVASNPGFVFEFDSQGNWTIVPGVSAPSGWNNIAYDQRGNFYASNPYSNSKVVRYPAGGGPAEVLAYADNNGVPLEFPGAIAVGPSGEVYVADDDRLLRIGPDGVVTLFDVYDTLNAFVLSVLVDDFGYVYVLVGPVYRYAPGDPNSRVLLGECTQASQGICGTYTLAHSPDRTRIYGQSYDYSINSPVVIAIDPDDGSVETVTAGFVSWDGMAVVPLRKDVDGDGDGDLTDLDRLVECMQGPYGGSLNSECDLADMDADGDVDLFDVRFFLWAHAALQSSNEALMSLEARYL